MRSVQGLQMKNRLLACLLICAVPIKYNNRINEFILVLYRSSTSVSGSHSYNHYFICWLLGICLFAPFFFLTEIYRSFLCIWHIALSPKQILEWHIKTVGAHGKVCQLHTGKTEMLKMWNKNYPAIIYQSKHLELASTVTVLILRTMYRSALGKKMFFLFYFYFYFS